MMRPLRDRPEFDRMLEAELAVVFVHVVWSIDSFRGRSIIQNLETAMPGFEWADDLGITFWEIDVSEETDLTGQLRTWLMLQLSNVEGFFTSGAGSFLWSRRASIVDSAVHIATLDAAIDRTRSAFATERY